MRSNVPAVLIGLGAGLGLFVSVNIVGLALVGDDTFGATVGDADTYEEPYDEPYEESVDEPADEPTDEPTYEEEFDPITVTVSRTCGASGDGDCDLWVREAAGISSGEVGMVYEGDVLTIVCLLEGDEYIKSSVLEESDDTWARLDSGGYVAAIFLDDEYGKPMHERVDVQQCP